MAYDAAESLKELVADMERAARDVLAECAAPDEGDLSKDPLSAQRCTEERAAAMDEARNRWRSGLFHGVSDDEARQLALHLCASKNMDPASSCELALRDVRVILAGLARPHDVRRANADRSL